MLYYLFTYLEKNYSIPGGRCVPVHHVPYGYGCDHFFDRDYGLWPQAGIDYLRFKQVGETVRNLGLEVARCKRLVHLLWAASSSSSAS